MRLKARASFEYDGVEYDREHLLDVPERVAVELIGQDLAMIWNLEDPTQRSQIPVGQVPPRSQGTPSLAVILTYRADVSTTQASDPGAGLVRWNATAVEDVTALYFDRLTADNGNDVTAMWAMVNPTRLVIQEADMALNQQHWTVAAPAILMADWFQVPVSFMAKGAGDPYKPQHQTRLLVFLITGG